MEPRCLRGGSTVHRVSPHDAQEGSRRKSPPRTNQRGRARQLPMLGWDPGPLARLKTEWQRGNVGVGCTAGCLPGCPGDQGLWCGR